MEETIANLAQQTFEETLLEYESESFSPLVSFSRYKEPHAGMNPVINIYVDKIPDWIDTPMSLAHNYLSSFSEFVRNGRCVEAPKSLKIESLDAAKTKFAYEGVVEADNFVHEVIDESLIVFSGEHVIWVLCEESWNGEETAQEEFDLIKETLTFV